MILYIMDPPVQIQDVFLTNKNNDFIIYFKTFLNNTTNVENEISKDTFLEYMLHYSNNIKYSVDTYNKILNITDIKILNIVNKSALSNKNKSPNESISLLMNYDSTYSESAKNLIIESALQVKNGDKFMCAINNLVIVIEITEDKLQKKKKLTFKLTYTNLAEDINAFNKKNIAHSIRKLIIPFKLAIE